LGQYQSYLTIDPKSIPKSMYFTC